MLVLDVYFNLSIGDLFMDRIFAYKTVHAISSAIGIWLNIRLRQVSQYRNQFLVLLTGT